MAPRRSRFVPWLLVLVAFAGWPLALVALAGPAGAGEGAVAASAGGGAGNVGEEDPGGAPAVGADGPSAAGAGKGEDPNGVPAVDADDPPTVPRMCASQPLEGVPKQFWYFGCWGDAPSSMRAAYVCQRHVGIDSQGWQSADNRSFRLFRDATDFGGAESSCAREAAGGHLAVADSQEVNLLVAKLCTADLLDGCFIGARRHQGTWGWVTGEPLHFTSWFEGQPQPKGWALSGDDFEVAILNWHHMPAPGGAAGAAPALQFLLGLALMVLTSVLACTLCCACGPPPWAAPTAEAQQTTRLVDTSTITGLRAMSALAIATGHCFGYQTTQPLDLQGGFAVTVFMFISGFVMAVAHADRSSGKGFDRDFLVRRAARLFPVHWVGLLLSYPLMNPNDLPAGIRIPALVLSIPTTFTLTHSWWCPPLLAGGNGASWTMSTFLFFYIAFGPLARCFKQGRNATTSTSGCFMVTLSALSVILPVLLYHLLIAIGTDQFQAYMGARSQPLARLPVFALGIVAGIRAASPAARASNDDEPSNSASRELLDSEGPDVVWSSGRCADRLSLLMLVLWGSAVALSWFGSGLEFRAAFELLMVPLLPTWVQSLTSAKGGVARRFLTLRGIQMIGEWSLSIYILQFPIWDLTRLAVMGSRDKRFQPRWAPLLVAEVVAAAALCHRLVEEPCRRWLQSCGSGARRPAAQPATELAGLPRG